MDFCVIPPLSRLDLMGEGKRVFILAQLWKKSAEYRDKVRELQAQGFWIIADNGAGDYDTTTTTEELIEIVKDLKPNEIIPLDVLFNKEATLYNLEQMIALMRQEGLFEHTQILAVPQGKDLSEWLDCYTKLLQNDMVKTIGLSKITVPYVYGTGVDDQGIMEGRHQCYEDLKAKEMLTKPIHCLGAGDPREFFKYLGDPIMRSTDSCFSVWAAMNNISWEEGNFERIQTPHDYFDREVSDEEVEIAQSNIDFLKKVLNVGEEQE